MENKDFVVEQILSIEDFENVDPSLMGIISANPEYLKIFNEYKELSSLVSDSVPAPEKNGVTLHDAVMKRVKDGDVAPRYMSANKLKFPIATAASFAVIIAAALVLKNGGFMNLDPKSDEFALMGTSTPIEVSDKSNVVEGTTISASNSSDNTPDSSGNQYMGGENDISSGDIQSAPVTGETSDTEQNNDNIAEDRTADAEAEKAEVMEDKAKSESTEQPNSGSNAEAEGKTEVKTEAKTEAKVEAKPTVKPADKTDKSDKSDSNAYTSNVTVGKNESDSVTPSVNEPVKNGADYSTDTEYEVEYQSPGDYDVTGSVSIPYIPGIIGGYNGSDSSSAGKTDQPVTDNSQAASPGSTPSQGSGQTTDSSANAPSSGTDTPAAGTEATVPDNSDSVPSTNGGANNGANSGTDSGNASDGGGSESVPSGPRFPTISNMTTSGSITKPDNAEDTSPDVANPEITTPDNTNSDNTNPDNTTSDNTNPEITNPDVTVTPDSSENAGEDVNGSENGAENGTESESGTEPGTDVGNETGENGETDKENPDVTPEDIEDVIEADQNPEIVIRLEVVKQIVPEEQLFGYDQAVMFGEDMYVDWFNSIKDKPEFIELYSFQAFEAFCNGEQ